MKNKTILYAEDDFMVSKIMSMILAREFKKVYTVKNGKEALAVFREHKPDIVITDLAMPEMSGFELVEKIKEESPDTKIVITTAYREEAEVIQGVKKLFKPIDRDEFFKCLDELGK
ncbi:response regulator [Geovibrio ferrireducens]|jgi:YesN/AraC family two-component response regulator|uniref:response regulator n=1 Tax=Geovibrio ferrireducens TaxID=46201 RepID=UPI002246B425|nr:response regulator [Geovibrio ferrireducens]